LPSSRTIKRLAALLLLAGCQEKLAAPAECPELCPGQYDVREDTLYALPGADSSYQGYRNAGQGTSLLVSHQFAAGEYRAAYRFARRTDSLAFGDSARSYTFDSLALELTLGYRDTTVHGLKLFLYRLPASLDSSDTFADIDGAFSPATIVDSFLVDDSVVTKRLRLVLSGSDTSKLSIPAGDSGVLALGVQMRADQPTGVKIGSVSAGSSGPSFINYVTVVTGDTTTPHSVISPGIQFNTFVSPTSEIIDTTLLTVGGAPSVRSLIRFPWPDFLKDSATLIRATLELQPAGTIGGLAGDTAFVVVQPILADFGGKSPAVSDVNFSTTSPVLPGDTDTISLEVRRQLTSWQGNNPVPPALIMALIPETSSFSRVIVGSSRTPGQVPRIIVTYVPKFPFGRP
jgi:hypothetical protein